MASFSTSFYLSIDRLEGRKKEWAILTGEDGRQIDFPRDLLPENAAEGDMLHLSIRIDPNAARDLRQNVRRLQDNLGNADPGGDLVL